MSTFIWRVSSAVLPVSGDTEQCVRKGFGDKSEVNRWTMVGYAARLNWETRTPRFLKESTGHHPTGLYWKLYNKAVGRKCAPQVDKEVQQLLSRGAFNTSVPWPHHCLSQCRQSQKLMKICAKVNIDRGKFFLTLILPQCWFLYEVCIYVYMKLTVLRQSDSVDQ